MMSGLPRDADRFRFERWWPGGTLLDAFDAAVGATPDKVAIVAEGGVRLSYRDLARATESAAAALAAAGLRQGDVLSIQLPNCAEFVALHLAATRLGAVTNPLLPNYRTNELSYMLAAARTRVAVTIAEHRGFIFPPMYDALRPGLPGLAEIFVIGEGDAASLGRCDALFRQPGLTPVPIAADGDALSALIFTSGTEARPKGVMHSHNTMLYGTREMAALLGLTADDVIWVASPVGHGTGFQWGVRQAIALGATMVLQDIWDPLAALRLIEAERCSFVLSATPFVAALAEAVEGSGCATGSLRIFGCAGAPIPAQLGEIAETRLGCTLIGMWGMTECFVASASAPTDPPAKRWGSDGRAMPGGELAIFDGTRGSILAHGEIGELAARGPFVALGYLDDPARTAATFREDGWLFSNDLATIDADGQVRLVGRMKDIVNRGGLKVSVKEIEDLMLRHPAVAQVAIVPVADAKLGETGCACVVPRAGARFDFRTMVGFLEDLQVAKFKLPEGLALLDALPVTPSGKIQKIVLRQRLEAGELARTSR